MKLLFKLFDYISALLLGTLASLAVYWVAAPGWNMALAMFAGMFIGMALLLLFLPLVGVFSTFFNFMPPAMIIAMLGGMGAGMAVSAGIALSGLLPVMLLFSVAVQIVLDLYNLMLIGEVKHAE